MRPKEVDIEFGFDKKIAASKPINGHGSGRVHKPISHADMQSFEGRVHKPISHADMKSFEGRSHKPISHADMQSFEMRLGPQGKMRPSA